MFTIVINKLQKLLKDRQFWLYGLIGLSGALLDFILYIVFYKLCGIPPVIASFLSVSAGIINNFILNSRHNFKVNDAMLARFVNFYGIGLGGAVLSSALILILFNAMGINATIAKLLTVPPVVILQFFLNRRFSFSERSRKKLKLKHVELLVINVVFLLVSLLFIKVLPADTGLSAPDEAVHYGYNVKLLLDDHRLPTSGKDDIALYKTCRTNLYGQVPCIYSYEVYPQANYIFSALVSWIAHAVTGISNLKGARLASMFWGIVFINLTYFTAFRITRKKTASAAITAGVGLIPQVILVSSYVNQDAHSLAIGAFICWAMVRLYQQQTRTSAILLGLACGGLLPLAKYNYFLDIVLIVAFLAFCWIRNKVSRRLLVQSVAWALLWFILLSSFWYIRNLILYHDILGQTFTLNTMQHYHALGQKHSVFSPTTLHTYAGLGFFDLLFHSFFAAYGYMQAFLDDGDYAILRFMVYLVGFLSVVFIMRDGNLQSRRKLIWIYGGLLLFILLSIAQVYYNSAVYDFEPQGRYLFNILSPLALGLALAYRINKNFKYVILCVMSASLYAFIGGLVLLLKIYAL